MTNEDRLPSRQWFVDEFGPWFITDTYSNVRDSDGFEEVFNGSLEEMRDDSPPDLKHKWESWQAGVSPGSVAAQYLEMLWAIHRDEFWQWRFDDL